MRISYWSSDVCSSDLTPLPNPPRWAQMVKGLSQYMDEASGSGHGQPAMQASGLTLLATLSSLRTVSPGTKLFTDSHLRWHARCNLTESRRMPTTGMTVRIIPWEETMGQIGRDNV